MARDYKTGRLLARVISGIGWAIGGAGALVTLFSFFSPLMDLSAYAPAAQPGVITLAPSGGQVFLMFFGVGLALVVYGAIVVAIGQATRAMMDNADYTRQLLDFIRKN